MGNRGLGWIIGLVVVILVAFNSVYIVSETERAVLLRFGEVVNPDVETGLHFKLPLVHTVRRFDGRILTVDVRPQRYLTIEKKPLDVDFYAKWRIYDTEAFYTSTQGEEQRVRALLVQRINTGLRNMFGERTVHEVVSGERDLVMIELTQRLNEIARREYGIEVVDIRVKRIDLPEAVERSVFDRMESEREREAREQRSTGREQAEVVRAAADREREVLLAQAYSQAERIRGEGDARSAAIYAAAFSQDPEFYAFTRSLSAYRSTFGDRGDLLIVDPSSEFFKHLKQVDPSR